MKCKLFSLGITLAVVLSCGCTKKLAPGAVGVQVTTAAQRDVPIFSEFSGQLLGSEDVSIVPQVTGTLEGIHFKEGSDIVKGFLIYTIDPKPMAAKAEQSRSELAQAQALLGRAVTDVKRLKPLAEANAIPERDYDNAVANADAAAANVAAKRAVLQEAELNLGYCRIYAPVNGTIGLSQAKVGDLVGAPPAISVLNTMSQLDPIVAQFSISEQEYLGLARRIGSADTDPTRAKIPLDLLLADGSVYAEKGYLKFANRQIDTQTGTLLMQATFPNPEKLLRPGMYAKVRAPIEQRKGAILVPQKAVQELQGLFQVYVVKPDNKVEIRQVTPGPKVAGFWVIEKGIQPGDRVIVEGIQKVQAEQVVNPESVAATGLDQLPAPSSPAAAEPISQAPAGTSTGATAPSAAQPPAVLATPR